MEGTQAVVVPPPCLKQFSDEVLERIILSTLQLDETRVLIADKDKLRTLVNLARVNSSWRRITRKVIAGYRFPEHLSIWPDVKVLGAHASETVEVVDVSVNRSELIAFLKWLVAVERLVHLKLTVLGAPYSHERLSQLEGMMVGRLFTNTGSSLRSIETSGMNCRPLLFTSLFNCRQLQSIIIHHYGNASGTILVNLLTLVIVANREHLGQVIAPLDVWRASMETVPNGELFAKACRATWYTVWTSYRSGVKETMLNMDGSDEKLIARVQSTLKSMDEMEEWVRIGLDKLAKQIQHFSSDAIPEKVLSGLVLRRLCSSDLSAQPLKQN